MSSSFDPPEGAEPKAPWLLVPVGARFVDAVLADAELEDAVLEDAVLEDAALDAGELAVLDSAHTRCSMAAPVQFAPPMAGAGLVQARERVLLPSWHADHGVHEAQSPSTRKWTSHLRMPGIVRAKSWRFRSVLI
jgi:hypothetical protein